MKLPTGQVEEVDIRTLPFVQFDGNEAHSQLYGMNFGRRDGRCRTRPGASLRRQRHENLGFSLVLSAGGASIVIDGMNIANSKYGIF